MDVHIFFSGHADCASDVTAGVYGRPNARSQGSMRGLGQALLQLPSSRESVCQGKGQLSDRLLGYVKGEVSKYLYPDFYYKSRRIHIFTLYY